MTMTWTSICTIRNCSDRVTIVARDARRGMGLRSDPVRDPVLVMSEPEEDPVATMCERQTS